MDLAKIKAKAIEMNIISKDESNEQLIAQCIFDTRGKDGVGAISKRKRCLI